MFLLLVIQIVLSLLFSSHHFTTASNEIGKSLINKTCSHTEFPGVFASQLWSQILAALVQILLTFLGLPWSWPCPKLMPNETLVKAYNLLKNASTHNQFLRSLCFTSLNVTLVISKRVQYYEEVKYIQAFEYVKIFNEALDYCTQVVELKESITFLRKFTTDIKAIMDLIF